MNRTRRKTLAPFETSFLSLLIRLPIGVIGVIGDLFVAPTLRSPTMTTVAPRIFSGTYVPGPLGLATRVLSGAFSAACLAVLITAAWLTPDPTGVNTHRQLGLAPCALLDGLDVAVRLVRERESAAALDGLKLGLRVGRRAEPDDEDRRHEQAAIPEGLSEGQRASLPTHPSERA